MPTPTVWAVPSMPSARIPLGIALRAKAFGPPRGVLTAAALRPADARPGSRTAPVRVSPDPREPDDRGGPAARPRRHVRHRTDCCGTGGPVAPRRPLLRTPRVGPRRNGRIQAEPDLRFRERDRDLAPSLAADPGRAPLLRVVGDPRRLPAQLRGRRILPLAVRVARGHARPPRYRTRDKRGPSPPDPFHSGIHPRVPRGDA